MSNLRVQAPNQSLFGRFWGWLCNSFQSFWNLWTRTALFSFFEKWSRHRSLLTILLAAADADRREHADERRTIDSIIRRSRTLRAVSRNELDDLIVRTRNLLADNKQRERAIRRACIAFSSDADLRMCALANAWDVVLSDRTLLQSERAYLDTLAKYLKISQKDKEKCAEVMTAKYKH